MPQDNLPQTKPYLIRAIHEWCSDNGFTPYLGVAVDASVDVPMAYVTNNQIVLNISYGATDALKMGNDLITFKGRFNGQVKDLMIPVARVVAIYAKENGQGMAFEATEAVFESETVAEEVPAARTRAGWFASGQVAADLATRRKNDLNAGLFFETDI